MVIKFLLVDGIEFLELIPLLIFFKFCWLRECC